MPGDPAALAASEREFPAWAGPAERLRFLLGWAVLAPSRYNAQPWLFEIEGPELRAYADPGRALPASDPDGREQLMACGAALVNLRLAAGHFGHATSVEVSPGHRTDGLLARVVLEERRPGTPEAEELFQAIPCRHTCRLPFDGRDPPAGLVTRLLREAHGEGVWLRPVEESERHAVADLVAEGDERLWSSARYRAELAAWSRPNGRAPPDGLPGWASGLGDAAAFLQPWLIRFRNIGHAEAERDRRRTLGTRALVVLGTPGDGQAEWIAAGEAMQRVLLRATAAGLAASFFHQPLAFEPLRRGLAAALGERGRPHAMLRLGYGGTLRPTPRRPIEDVLRRFERRSPRTFPIVRSAPFRPEGLLPAPGSGHPSSPTVH